MKKILNIDHTWKTSLQARTCLTSNSVFITSLEDVQLKNIFQKTTLRTLLRTGNGNLTLLSLLPKLETLSKIIPSLARAEPPSYMLFLSCFCLPQQATTSSSCSPVSSLTSLPTRCIPSNLAAPHQPHSPGDQKKKNHKNPSLSRGPHKHNLCLQNSTSNKIY